MLHSLRLLLLGVHFLVAGAINLVIVLLRPFNPDNSRRCGRVYSLPALQFLGLELQLQDEVLRTLGRPCVIVANHQSNFDLFMFGCAVPPLKKGAFQMAITAGVPIVPLCCNAYINSMRLNRWRSGQLIIRALPPIPTAGLTLDDMPALMERCREQMADCIDALDTAAAATAASPAH